ncbi:hypothetical protein DQ238_10315 [Geodermatophilus sp. TF02-6]|uniref:hypothetical protein n=1 Tax=Geodermatophilus sp. TF02-6 TaxID=2250575 RepID=UPI000DFEC21D|nr:hypothetical protein [Geodermatophilus sp. TF02-6]RBY79580.1 hypothetical protein DQ238_10315 [Geodermatophilus sp. TF02-6]
MHTRINDVRAVLRGAVADRVIPRDPSEGIALPCRRTAATMTLRQVCLAPSLVDLLAEHVAAHCPEGTWLFTGEAGQSPHQNTVGYRWRTTIRAADLTGVKLHDLRHS